MGLLSATFIAAATLVWLGSSSARRMKAIAQTGAPQVRRRRFVRARRRRREDTTALLGQAPIVAELLATALSAGATIPEALTVVFRVTEEPLRSQLDATLTAIELGADPYAAWSPWLDEPALSPIAHAIIRSQHSGAPVSAVLDAAASDMRRAYRDDVESRARAAGVRAVAPLALCYLPAYLLVGVVPVVAGFANTMFA